MEAGKATVDLLFEDPAAGDQFGSLEGLLVLIQGNILKIEMVGITHGYNNDGECRVIAREKLSRGFSKSRSLIGA